MTGLDHANLERWAVVLGRVADRITQERGVQDPWSLSVEDDVLWANYGDLRVRLGADVQDEAELFDEVDGWVAFERTGPGGVELDRDREAKDAWRAGLPALREFWEPVVVRVLSDVVRTTRVAVPWSVELDEREFDVPPAHGLRLTFGAEGPPMREAPFPQWLLRLPHQGFTLPATDDVEDAAGHLAAQLQDYVIEELPGAWPPCPGHHHPMALTETSTGQPAWQCPAGTGPAHEVGSLPAPD